jgi:hypothetical protein
VYDSEKLAERIAKLAGGVAVIKVQRLLSRLLGRQALLRCPSLMRTCRRSGPGAALTAAAYCDDGRCLGTAFSFLDAQDEC